MPENPERAHAQNQNHRGALPGKKNLARNSLGERLFKARHSKKSIVRVLLFKLRLLEY